MRTRKPIYQKAYTDKSLGIDIWETKFRGDNYYFEAKIGERPAGRRYFYYEPNTIKFVSEEIVKNKIKLKSYLALRRLVK